MFCCRILGKPLTETGAEFSQHRKMSASDSKRNSVSPPNSVRSSEEEPLDFSRATAEDSRESKGSDDKTSGAVTSTQCGDESGATTRLFLPSPSPRRDSSPQTSSSDMDPASDPLSKLPSPLMFGRTSLPTPLTAADLMQSSLDLLTPAFNPLYTFPFPVTQMDPALSPGYLDPDFMRYRQQVGYPLIQRIGYSDRTISSPRFRDWFLCSSSPSHH